MFFLRNFWCFGGLVLIASVVILTVLKHWNLYTLRDVPFGWVIQRESFLNVTEKKEIQMPSLEQEVPFKKATFGMGCFWANDALFGAQRGVLRTRVGYAGGTTPNPVYKDMGDHTEVIEIDYDPEIISYHDLLKLFWDNHEYGVTTVIKRQYMSLILYHEEEQRHIAELDIKVEAGKRNEKLITEVAPAGPFYPAEDYHQKYRLQKHGWIVEELNLTPEQLQTSTSAAKLNGYVAGVGTREDLERDLKMLGIPEKIASFIGTWLDSSPTDIGIYTKICAQLTDFLGTMELACPQHVATVIQAISQGIYRIGFPWWCKRKNTEQREQKTNARATKRKVSKFKH